MTLRVFAVGLLVGSLAVVAACDSDTVPTAPTSSTPAPAPAPTPAPTPAPAPAPAPIAVQSLVVAPERASIGRTVKGTVTLNRAADPGGVLVVLSTDRSSSIAKIEPSTSLNLAAAWNLGPCAGLLDWDPDRLCASFPLDADGSRGADRGVGNQA